MNKEFIRRATAFFAEYRELCDRHGVWLSCDIFEKLIVRAPDEHYFNRRTNTWQRSEADDDERQGLFDEIQESIDKIHREDA